MALSKEEANTLRQEPQKEEHKPSAAKPKHGRKILISAIVIFALIVTGVGLSYANSKKPAPLDSFAKCLTENGAVMYGAEWCKYTQAQKSMFGNSVRYLNYKDFSENPEVTTTPTWFINGQKYAKVQSLDKLAVITGCAIR